MIYYIFVDLRCGGQACYKCGACRDWYLDCNTEDIVKRSDATCTCDHMFSHSLVPHPDHVGHKYYPLQNLICMCRDNY